MFTFGFGRVEDLAGVAIVLFILASAVLAGAEAIHRLFHPAPLRGLLMVGAAGLLGFIGNEAVAILRIRTGRLINSAALMADGYHARADGLTSLAVVFGAMGVWQGFPLADPVAALLITLILFGIVWQSGKTVFTHLLDGVDRSVVEEIRHAASHVPGIEDVVSVRARWMGHRLMAELDLMVAIEKTVGEASAVADTFEKELKDHLPALDSAHIRIRPSTPS
jgi:cation diffusion facilitator family transporter